MAGSDQTHLSRRRWLGLATASTIGASVGSSLTAAPVADAEDKMRGARIYNIRDFGAKGDGTTLDTAALQLAIDACHKDDGGIVLVPAGVFVIGTVELKSNVTLRIAAQGKLLGSGHGQDYYAAEKIPLRGDATLEDGHVGLLFAVNAENITIEGPGTIDGQGDLFYHQRESPPPPAGISGPHRPYHLLFYQCKNLTVRNIFLKDSAFHSVRIIQSDYVWLTGIHIHSRRINNSDGFHFISARYVHVTGCDVQTQDDACALFGSCQFVTVSNSSFSTRWSVFRFGGGVAKNITVSNCLIYETYGCPIKMRCSPGSRFEDISFSNLVMKDVTGPISIGNSPHGRRHSDSPSSEKDGEAPGIVRNISFNGIHVVVTKPIPLPDCPFESKYNPGEMFSCITLNAFDEAYLDNISFNDVQVIFPGGGTAEQAAVRDVPKVAGEYYSMGVPPACALFARNVRGLTLQNVRFEVATPDLRPAVVLDHVAGAMINGFTIQGNPVAESVLRFIDTQDVLLSAARLATSADVFLRVEGADSRGITLDGGDISKATTPLSLKNKADSKAVKLRG